jgi:hypothetical protein
MDVPMSDLMDKALAVRAKKGEKAARAAARQAVRETSPGPATSGGGSGSSPEVSSGGSGPVAKRQSTAPRASSLAAGELSFPVFSIPQVPLFPAPLQTQPPSLAFSAARLAKTASSYAAAMQSTPQTAEADGKHAVAAASSSTPVPMQLRSADAGSRALTAAEQAEAWAHAPVGRINLGGSATEPPGEAGAEERRREERRAARESVRAAQERKRREEVEAREAHEAAVAAVRACEARRAEHAAAAQALQWCARSCARCCGTRLLLASSPASTRSSSTSAAEPRSKSTWTRTRRPPATTTTTRTSGLFRRMCM